MASEGKDGCKHYKRRCAFIAPCCQKTYPCRVCHDEKESHQINRHAVKEIQCLQCSNIQQVSNTCVSCATSFGEYFCEICRLFDDDTSKGQFHCDKCGICRVGGRDKFFHCDRCDSCLAKALSGSHKCIEKGTRSNCPICMEDLHTSRQEIDVPRCGHFIHKECLKAMMKNGNFSCSICGESLHNMSTVWQALDNEVANTPMPPEYSDFYVQVLCKDCHKESRVVFHVIGLKCQECGSYNTCRTAEPERSDSESSETDVRPDDSVTTPAARTSEAQGTSPADDVVNG